MVQHIKKLPLVKPHGTTHQYRSGNRCYSELTMKLIHSIIYYI